MAVAVFAAILADAGRMDVSTRWISADSLSTPGH
jgi:hypothetical protein